MHHPVERRINGENSKETNHSLFDLRNFKEAFQTLCKEREGRKKLFIILFKNMDRFSGPWIPESLSKNTDQFSDP